MSRISASGSCIVLAMLVLAAHPANSNPPAVQVRDAIKAESLRGHLSFMASDLLEGRDTPSRGQDIAAEYIAAQFRRAGLEPIGDDGFFQTATLELDDPQPDDLAGTLHVGDQVISLDSTRMSVLAAAHDVAVNQADATIVPFPMVDPPAEGEWPAIIITNMPSLQSIPAAERQGFFEAFNDLTSKAEAGGVEAILNIEGLSEPSAAPSRQPGRARPSGVPIFLIHNAELATRLFSNDAPPRVPLAIKADLSYRLPAKKQVAVRNVVGLLRGSDPTLADSYVLVTAHYDHVGLGAAVDGDAIYNGANDDGSGTVSVIELAAALASIDPRPKRSILFMCFYGEERGLLGSRHYVQHPLVPLAATVANVNLEHMGRTDDVEGPTAGKLMMTGFDYSDLVSRFVTGAGETGITVHHHPLNSAMFFARSDNVTFALGGVPAHTFAVSFIFPDYHGAGDHWDRIDYDNMELVVETVALGLIELGNDEAPVNWNADHRSTGRYIEAWRRLHGIEATAADEGQGDGDGASR